MRDPDRGGYESFDENDEFEMSFCQRASFGRVIDFSQRTTNIQLKWRVKIVCCMIFHYVNTVIDNF